MADLQLNRRWEPYAPKLDGNDELERPFLFELACGLTRKEMRELDDQVSQLLKERHRAVLEGHGEPNKKWNDKKLREWSEALAEKLLAAEIDVVTEVLGPFVRMGSEPLTIAGKPITTLRQYLEAVAVVADQAALMEPLRALRQANSLNGEQVLFSGRHSGGGTTTPSRSAAKRNGQKGGR